jgi:2-amino-4-hydroxy-6-hydroxymethyldihydropteridine diphosphokinase
VETRVVLALGSNVGDRLVHLQHAVKGLSSHIRIRAVSPVYRSEPVGYADQPSFLNAILDGWSTLDAWDLLAAAHEVEAAEGRERTYPGAPRTLDIDLVLHGELVMQDPDLTIPHPRWKQRSFVLAPLADVAPELVDPTTGRTVLEIWEAHRSQLPPLARAASSDVLWSRPL